jgi:hypothetical protein
MRATQMSKAARPNERERMSQSVFWRIGDGDHIGARGRASQLSVNNNLDVLRQRRRWLPPSKGARAKINSAKVDPVSGVETVAASTKKLSLPGSPVTVDTWVATPVVVSILKTPISEVTFASIP